METRKIGSLDVSIVGVGCNNFGGRIDEAATKAVVDAALDAGINFFDTADVYGGTKSEEFMGRVFKGRRDQAIIATKFGIKLDDERPGGGSPAYIKRAVEDSLTRLATDRIDLYQIHRPDTSVPIADTLGALDELVKAGKVREIACSNFSAEQLREAETVSTDKNLARFVSVQNEYSLFKREPETDGVLNTCAELNIAFLPYFPLASGLLTGKYRRNQPLPEGTRIKADSKQLTDANLDKVEALIGYAEANGHTILELAFGWLLAQPVVASVIAGATKPEQIQANVGAANWILSADEVKAVNALL